MQKENLNGRSMVEMLGDEVVESYYGCEGSHGGDGRSPVACAGGKVVSIPMPVTDTLAACENGDLGLKFF